MASWTKIDRPIEDGRIVSMQAPIIVSVSRSTDVPAFYADWFFHRLDVGYSAWINPFNGVKSYVTYDKTRFIVFWSKNPLPLIDYLDILKEKNIGCYIQYTLNDYELEGLEKGVPSLNERIDTFKRLVDILGYNHVIWRFDPLFLADNINEDNLLDKIEKIGEQLCGYTEKLVFSFADMYKKVRLNLNKNAIRYVEWTDEKMLSFTKKLAELNKKWNYKLATCGEKIDLKQYGVEHNRCVDDELIIRLAYKDKQLMDFLKVKIHEMPMSDLFGNVAVIPDDAVLLPNKKYATRENNTDKGQRPYCGCIVSKDIGEYNTCPHLCEYCYANASKNIAISNWNKHNQNPFSDSITGK